MPVCTTVSKVWPKLWYQRPCTIYAFPVIPWRKVWG